MKKNILAILFGATLLFVLEAGLRVWGVAGRDRAEDAFAGFYGANRLFAREGDDYVTAPNKRVFFNYQKFPARKKTGTIRIFCFGGSSTFGHPYDYRTAFPRWLKDGLDTADPARQYEVINAGGISYGSRRIARLVEEALEYDPDMFIFYMGHNEFLEEITFEDVINRPRFLVRLEDVLSNARIYTAMKTLLIPLRDRINPPVKKTKLDEEVKTILDEPAGYEKFDIDMLEQEERAGELRLNVERITGLAKKNGVKVILSSVPSNIKDFRPFKSLHEVQGLGAEWERLYKEGEGYFEKGDFAMALAGFRAAGAINNQDAGLWYKTAQSLERLNQGEPGMAKEFYIRARDLDRAPLRATTSINKTLESAAAGAYFTDIERLFDTASPSGMGDRTLFMDHCHPTIRGYQMIAEEYLKIIAGIYGFSVPGRQVLQAGYDRALSGMDSKFFAMGAMNVGRTLNWAMQFSLAGHVLEEAAVKYPDDPEILYLLGNSYRGMGRDTEAAEQYRKAAELDPANPLVIEKLGASLLKTGRLDEAERVYANLADGLVKSYSLGYIYSQKGDYGRAVAELEKALSFDSGSIDARMELGNAKLKLDDSGGALAEFAKVLEKNPENALAYHNTGLAYDRMGQPEESIRAYMRALEIDPGQLGTLYNLGGLYYRMGEYEKALRQYELYIVANPGNPEIYNIMEIIKKRLGEGEATF